MPNTTFTKLELANWQSVVEKAFSSPVAQWDQETITIVEASISALNDGVLRIMQPSNNGWKHFPWLQKAILCYFKLHSNTTYFHSGLPYKDKVPSRFSDEASLNAWNGRIVPPAHARYGSYIGNHCVIMPSFINIGAYVDDFTMIDTWSTVGAGAQIGKNVHISGGAGIGGILEPPQASPTIIEDACFIGARSEIAEGVVVKQGAVIAMGTFISQSTRIYDRTTKKTFYGVIPENAVVVPGNIPSSDGSYSLNAAIIVKYADAKTRAKIGINQLLRD